MKIIDLHCDTICRMMEDKENLALKENGFHVDIEKLKKGNSMAQFFAMYVDLCKEGDPLDNSLEMIDKFYVELRKNENSISFAGSYDDMMNNLKNKKISAFLTIEEGGVLKGKLYNLRNYYRLGVRLITLTWNYPNEIGFPNNKLEYKEKGLTQFGEEVVSEMNNLGMIIDVSHLSDKGFLNVADISSKPFVASHSNSRSITNHCRNLTDEMIRVIGEKGGVVGINFCNNFIGNSKKTKIEDIIIHIKHIANIGGIECVALGSDFDGIEPYIEIEDFSQMDKLILALEKNNFNQADIDKILNKNAIRIIKEVL